VQPPDAAAPVPVAAAAGALAPESGADAAGAAAAVVAGVPESVVLAFFELHPAMDTVTARIAAIVSLLVAGMVESLLLGSAS
jgi:hypothetical protein